MAAMLCHLGRMQEWLVVEFPVTHHKKYQVPMFSKALVALT